MEAKERVFITVIGRDKKGIVATISTFLYECGVNIVDINQRIMDDGYFVMTMVVDVRDKTLSMDDMVGALEKIGQDLQMKIQVQHENIFKMMHRV